MMSEARAPEQAATTAIPASRLRPLAAGDIIDEAIRLYRGHFRAFLTIGALVLAPVGVLQLLAQFVFANSASDVAGVALAALSALIGALGYIAMAGAMIHAGSEAWHGRAVAARAAYDVGLDQAFGLLGLALLVALALGGLSITVIGIPFAIYLGVSWALAFHARVIERASITGSLGRSRQLVRDHWWRVVGIFILVAIIQSVISILFTLPGQIAGVGTTFPSGGATQSTGVLVLAQLGATAGQIVVAPLTFLSFVLLYYDQRVRKEGLDLEIGLERLERSLPASSAPPPRMGPTF